MTDLKTMNDRCPNCARTMVGDVVNYCAGCGQPRARRITLAAVGREVKEQFISLDFRLVRTARTVLSDPGRLLRDYLSGRRLPYTNPMKFLFLSATLYLLAITLLDIQVSTHAGAQQTARSVVAILNYLIFVLLVPVAAMLRWLFRPRINFAESYVVLCYLWSGYLILATVLAALMITVSNYYLPARTTLGILFLTIGLRSYFGQGWFGALLRVVILFVGYVLFTILLLSLLLFVAHLAGIPGLPGDALSRSSS